MPTIAVDAEFAQHAAEEPFGHGQGPVGVRGAAGASGETRSREAGPKRVAGSFTAVSKSSKLLGLTDFGEARAAARGEYIIWHL